VELAGPPIHRHAVQILTPSFQFSGELEVVGNLVDFLNDAVRDALILHQAQITPLVRGGAMKDMARPQVSLRKQEVVFLYLTEPEVRAEVRLMARKEPLIIYTSLAVLRGELHLPAEVRANDFLAATSGIFIPVTSARLFMLTDLSPFPDACDFLLLGRRCIRFYHAT
jgi:hypothetical protein